MKTLRERLIGAWNLVSYQDRPVDGSAPSHPFTEHPQGMILYTPDGFMSAQLCAPDRKPLASGDWFRGTPDEYRAQATTYIAYTGPFHVDEERQTLTHSMFISLFPNWIGQTQARIVGIDGPLLNLASAAPFQSGGKTVLAFLQWKRAAAD